MIQTEIEIQTHRLELRHIDVILTIRTNILWAAPPQRMIQMVSKYEEFTCCVFLKSMQ